MARRTESCLALGALSVLLSCQSPSTLDDPRPAPAPLVQGPSKERQPRRATFFPKEYEPYADPGSSEIVGQAFFTTPDGERVYPTNPTIFMNPVTSYAHEWYRRSIIGGIDLEPADERAHDYHWVAKCDSLGRFRFRRVPSGEYYIGCRVLPEEAFVHAEISVGENETVMVVLMRELEEGVSESIPQAESPSRSREDLDVRYPFGRLNPDAPPETAQWGRLAGVWECTLPIVGEDGTVREEKATWTWTYTIDGYAIRDTYVGHRANGPDFYGSALRIYNPDEKEWEVAWVDNGAKPDDRRDVTKLFRATYENDRIIMRQVDGDPSWRTTFYDIEDDSFEWLNEPSQQRMHCRRIGGSPH